MIYQLVLQWRSESGMTLEDLVDLETTLRSSLSRAHYVDGHDIGSAEANIFVHTDDPLIAFAEAEHILESGKWWGFVRAAFRKRADDEYVALWPPGMTDFSIA